MGAAVVRVRPALRRQAVFGYAWLMKSDYLYRLGMTDWLKAAFSLPFVPSYYAGIPRTTVRKALMEAEACDR
jgi:hypothetical protein